MKVVVLAGGVGGARFLRGVKLALGLPAVGSMVELVEPLAGHEITAVVNVGDDVWLHGVRICPDLDTCMYTLGGGIDGERGWGRDGETWTVSAELAGYAAEPSWFGLGDRDLATHLVRSQLLRAGRSLTEVTEVLCTRWRPGVRLLPVTNDRVETHVEVDDPAESSGRRAMHFQEWWVRHKAGLPAHRFVSVGADTATITPAVRDAIDAADAVLVAPSNPVVSIGAMLAVPGLAGAIRTTTARVVGVSPIIAGRALRGMAETCLATIGVPATALGVGAHYGARSVHGLLDGWLVHTGDEAEIPGVEVRAVPLLMSDLDASAELARRALELAGMPSGAAPIDRYSR